MSSSGGAWLEKDKRTKNIWAMNGIQVAKTELQFAETPDDVVKRLAMEVWNRGIASE